MIRYSVIKEMETAAGQVYQLRVINSTKFVILMFRSVHVGLKKETVNLDITQVTPILSN